MTETQTNVEKLTAAKRKFALFMWAFVIELKNFIREKTSFELIPWSKWHTLLAMASFYGDEFHALESCWMFKCELWRMFFILHCMFWVLSFMRTIFTCRTQRVYFALWINIPKQHKEFSFSAAFGLYFSLFTKTNYKQIRSWIVSSGFRVVFHSFYSIFVFRSLNLAVVSITVPF